MELVEKHANQYHLDNATKESIESLPFYDSYTYQKETNSIIRHLRI